MKEITLTMRVMNFTNDRSNLKYIKYDHDCGHSYSYIDHPIVQECEDTPELEEILNEWLYENDECPPCGIYIKKDGSSKSSCGCNDNLDKEQIRDIVEELTEFSKSEGLDVKYLVSYE